MLRKVVFPCFFSYFSNVWILGGFSWSLASMDFRWGPGPESRLSPIVPAAVVASYTKPNFSPDPAGCTRIFPRLVYCTYMYILHHITKKWQTCKKQNETSGLQASISEHLINVGMRTAPNHFCFWPFSTVKEIADFRSFWSWRMWRQSHWLSSTLQGAELRMLRLFPKRQGGLKDPRRRDTKATVLS